LVWKTPDGSTSNKSTKLGSETVAVSTELTKLVAMGDRVPIINRNNNNDDNNCSSADDGNKSSGSSNIIAIVAESETMDGTTIHHSAARGNSLVCGAREVDKNQVKVEETTINSLSLKEKGSNNSDGEAEKNSGSSSSAKNNGSNIKKVKKKEQKSEEKNENLNSTRMTKQQQLLANISTRNSMIQRNLLLEKEKEKEKEKEPMEEITFGFRTFKCRNRGF
jgi:hypothetical protein